jgi:transcription elongation GreA/GreB family factor
MLTSGFKSRLLQAAKENLQHKINTLNDQLAELTRGIENESKSSAGDKHETARAMVQLEQEKLGRQLQELERQTEILKQISSEEKTTDIRLGSVIRTNKEIFFLSIPMGRLIFEGNEIILLSTTSPLGNLLIHKKLGEVADLNGKTYQIHEFF